MSFVGDFTTVRFDLSTLFTVLIKMELLDAVIHRIFHGMNFFCCPKHQQMLIMLRPRLPLFGNSKKFPLTLNFELKTSRNSYKIININITTIN